MLCLDADRDPAGGTRLPPHNRATLPHPRPGERWLWAGVSEPGIKAKLPKPRFQGIAVRICWVDASGN